MDVKPEDVKPISDDQELAKVLAGVSQDSNNLNFEETPVPIIRQVANPNGNTTTDDSPNPVAPQPAAEPASDSVEPSGGITPNPDNNKDIEGIKKDALSELRPLVDKLELAPDEKFDIYLMLIRSTDDKTLIAPAHVAARNIPDETRRAQALLDVIKEIDFLATPQETII